MRSTSRRPCRSNRQSSTFSALAENSAKFVPRPSQVDPKGCGSPAVSRMLRLGDETKRSKGRNNKAELGDCARVQRAPRAPVPDIGAAVGLGIGIEDLTPSPGKGHLDAVVAMHLGREIHDHEAALMGVAPLAQPGKHAAISVMHDQPFKPRRLAVELMQGRHRPVQAVEIADQALDAGMPRVFQQVPVEGVIVLPFIYLSELAAHEKQLLAGMTEHEAVIGAQIGEALPLVAGHASENGALPMHDLIMGEGQNEVLEKSVVKTKQDLPMVVLAVDRILADVI